MYSALFRDFRCCPKQHQQRWNSYMAEIRTDWSVCQCMGPLKGPENLMSTHSFSPALWHFLSSMRLHTREKTSTSSSPLFCEQNGLLLLFLVTSGQNVKSSQKVACKTKYSLNENGQELVFLDDLWITCYFYRQFLFSPLTCAPLGSYWILERGKEHKVYSSTSLGLQAFQGESL